MAMENWAEIYRSYTAAELNTEIEDLKKSLKGGFSVQGAGSVNHQRDLAQLESRLQAATRVKNSRAGGGSGGRNPMKGSVDFSGNRWGQL